MTTFLLYLNTKRHSITNLNKAKGIRVSQPKPWPKMFNSNRISSLTKIFKKSTHHLFKKFVNIQLHDTCMNEHMLQLMSRQCTKFKIKNTSIKISYATNEATVPVFGLAAPHPP
jgi:hypothetical protein